MTYLFIVVRVVKHFNECSSCMRIINMYRSQMPSRKETPESEIPFICQLAGTCIRMRPFWGTSLRPLRLATFPSSRILIACLRPSVSYPTNTHPCSTKIDRSTCPARPSIGLMFRPEIIESIVQGGGGYVIKPCTLCIH
jgi:hypothetical protein